MLVSKKKRFLTILELKKEKIIEIVKTALLKEISIKHCDNSMRFKVGDYEFKKFYDTVFSSCCSVRSMEQYERIKEILKTGILKNNERETYLDDSFYNPTQIMSTDLLGLKVCDIWEGTGLIKNS